MIMADDEAIAVVSGAVENMGVKKVALMALDMSPTGRMVKISPGAVEVMEDTVDGTASLVGLIVVLSGPGGATMLIELVAFAGADVVVASNAELVASIVGVGVT
jgi:hypothetical protein